jgi:hypothetical protein
LPEKSAPDRRVDLAVAPVSAWPDGDWYAPCEPDRGDLGEDSILKLASTYNTFLCSLIRNSMTAFALTTCGIVASLDLRLAGVTPHRLSELVEQRVRSSMVEWMSEHGVPARPTPGAREFVCDRPDLWKLGRDLVVEFPSDGDIAFWRDRPDGPELLATIAISGGVDSATALEQYAAAAGWFRGALVANSCCENILLSVDDSAALESSSGP